MIGTIFSAKLAMRRMPPMKMKPASAKITMPVSQTGMPKAVRKASAIEFACTMFPMKPRATMIVQAKKAASALLPRPSEM